MIKRPIATLGVLVTATFIIGFISLFTVNPNTFEEANNVSIAAYNLIGMDGRFWAITIYLTVGLLNISFCLGLLRELKIQSADGIGGILLAIAAILWISFGIVPYQYQSDLGIHLFLIRISSMIFLGSAGLILVSAGYFSNGKDKFIKIYTLSTGLIIIIISAFSIFIYNDKTWIRTNLSLAIYFVWFGVFGLYYLMKVVQSEQRV